jgi:hypothetical protein
MQTVDERGKFFTEKIRKQSVEVLVTTVHGQVRGHVYVLAGQRVKDLLNNGNEQFMALTEVSYIAQDGTHIDDVAFMALNKSHVISVIPINEPPTSSEY